MKQQTTKQVYDSPKTFYFELTPEGLLCASTADISNFEREQNAWEW